MFFAFLDVRRCYLFHALLECLSCATYIYGNRA